MKIINLSEYKRKKSGDMKMNGTLEINNIHSVDNLIDINSLSELSNNICIEDVSNYFLTLAPMSNKKLQKICFYAYSWYLNLTNKELFENEFQAWRHGPVNPKLYTKYKPYGYSDISTHKNVILPDTLKLFLDKIYEKYGHLTAGEIEQLSHIEDPWKKTRNGLFDFQSSNRPIHRDVIEKYYINTYGNIFTDEIDFEEIINKSWDR